MGSSKKHKKEAKKSKHRSRSKSPERPEKEKRRHHKRHHKDKKKEKQITLSSSSDDDCILVPPPPKISRPATPPPPTFLTAPPPPTITKTVVPNPPTITPAVAPPSPPPPPTSAEASLSIEETNRLRAKLGLKPLEVPKAFKKDDSAPEHPGGGTDMGEFVHKPAENIAKKVQTEKLKAKLAERKERRKLEAKLSQVKKLGEASDDEDTKAWVEKSRKSQLEKEKADKKAKELDDMDAVFGIGELVEDELRSVRKTAYTARDLRGLRVEHAMDGFSEGRDVILTLKDRGVLDEQDDTLINVNMIDEERYKKNIDRRKQKPHQFGYDAMEEGEFDEFGEPKKPNLLGKYDEEIEGEQKTSFQLGVDEARQKAVVRHRLMANKRIESLVMPSPQLAAEFYTEQELVAKFRKPKKKIRKIRERKPRMLKADDLLAQPDVMNGHEEDVPSSEEWLKGVGSRRTQAKEKLRVKEEPWEEDPMDVDDMTAPPEDLSDIKVEADEDDSELEMALRKARKMKQKEAMDESAVNRVASVVLSDEVGYGALGPGGSIVLNATAEFCRTLGDIPTYGLAGNRDEEAQELLEYEKEMKAEKLRQEEAANNRGGWNEVEMDDKQVDIMPFEVPILDAEPDLGTGVAGALRLAVSKGYLEKESCKRPSATRFAHLQAQNYSIEDKAHVEDDKFGRRERYCGPTSDFKEKESYKPNVKLDYIDDEGHLLSAKEAFRYLSHKFHGKGPGKNKVEKRMKKCEQEVLMKQMSSTDTPLGTLNMLQHKQKETQSPFIVLSGSKQLQLGAPPTISKTKL